jgi:transposase-like protein
VKKGYRVLAKEDTGRLAEALAKDGQLLLPMVALIEDAKLAVDELIDVLGRASIEAVLLLSAQQVAGPKHQGKKGGPVRWHGAQVGTVPLSQRKLRVTRPRLRGDQGETPIPAYLALNEGGSALGERMLDTLLRGVSTRNYQRVIPEMAETVGVSKSAVSREFVEASAEALAKLVERRLDDREWLVIYLDGMVFGETHVLAAVGVDDEGNKRVLGLVEGASENAASCVSLLENLVARGVDPGKKHLFVIDGSKALRSAIDRVFGQSSPVQRCRLHKVKNVCDKLPEALKDQVKATLRAAYRLDAREGLARLKKQAEWLDGLGHPAAARSLLEGLEETFTINRLELSPALRRGLATTNIIESPNGGVRQRTGRVSRWRDGNMVLRWAAAAFLKTEDRYRKLMGHKDLWMLKEKLGREAALDRDGRAA